MVLARGKKWFGIALVVIACAACAARPIKNLEDRDVPISAQNLSPDQIERAIISAGVGRGWQMSRGEPGHVTGQLAADGMIAVIDVAYTQKSYSITLDPVKSVTKDGTGNYRRHDGWVRNLDKDIRRQLSVAAVQRPS